MTKFRKALTFFASAVGFGTVLTLPAQAVPPLFTQQGRLLDSDSQPVDGTIAIVFTLYDAPSGGTGLWTETQDVTLDDGYFSAQIGEETPLDPELFEDGETLYLGVKIGTDPEMTPRQPLVSVPYAVVADNVIGDITPTSVSIPGVGEVIASDGTWQGPTTGLAGPKGDKGDPGDPAQFSSLISVVTADSESDTSALVEVACAAGGTVTGGGCLLSAGSEVTMKNNNPGVTAGRPTSWVCSCIAASGNCSVRGYAVCAQDP